MALTTTLPRSIFLGMTVYVAFLLTTAAHAETQPPVPPMPQPVPQPVPQPMPQAVPQGMPAIGSPTPYGPLPPPAPPFRDTIYGAHANPGPPGSPGELHPHYPEYQTRYGIWYQPRSFHEPTRKPYRPLPFRPRGLGNLFADDCQHDRMDYNRYVVQELPSRYGPSYYPKYSWAAECLVRPERHYSPPVWGAAE